MSAASQNGSNGVRPAKQARSQRRQRAILDAAHRLLETVGYEKMKMEEIAAEADSSVGTLYQRFSNKDGLLDALLGETLVELEQLIETKLTPEQLNRGRREALQVLIGIIVDFMRRNQGFVRALTLRQLRDEEGIMPLQPIARTAVDRTWEALVASDPTLDSPEGRARFTFALQMAIGTTNNAILNRPGPLLIDDARLVGALTVSVEHLMMHPDLPL